MKPISCLLMLILLFHLMIPGNAQCSLDSLLDRKIKEALRGLEHKPSGVKKISCTSVKRSGKLSSCPAGMVVTGCSCGYGCGSWDVQAGNTCHCQCSGMDWTTARCCRLV